MRHDEPWLRVNDKAGSGPEEPARPNWIDSSSRPPRGPSLRASSSRYIKRWTRAGHAWGGLRTIGRTRLAVSKSPLSRAAKPSQDFFSALAQRCSACHLMISSALPTRVAPHRGHVTLMRHAPFSSKASSHWKFWLLKGTAKHPPGACGSVTRQKVSSHCQNYQQRPADAASSHLL